MPRKNVTFLLEGRFGRTIGRSDQAMAMVSDYPELFPMLIAGLWSAHPIVRMPTEDATEKITRERGELLLPYKKQLLGLMTEAQQQKLRWHLAASVPRLRLNADERQVAIPSLNSYLEDRSSIAKTFPVQGPADLAQQETNI
jgi:hypothetical protein